MCIPVELPVSSRQVGNLNFVRWCPFVARRFHGCIRVLLGPFFYGYSHAQREYVLLEYSEEVPKYLEVKMVHTLESSA